MCATRSRELESKQIGEMITELFQILHEDEQILSAPSSDHGIFKYTGSNTQAQNYLSKISRKRESERIGLGIVIQRADFIDHFRVSIDIEISAEVAGKDPMKTFQSMFTYCNTEYGMQGPSIILYSQPAYSGKRGWAEKKFVGFEVELRENELHNLNRAQKKILDQTRKLCYCLDYALTEL